MFAPKLRHEIITFKLQVLLFWGLFHQSKLHSRHFFFFFFSMWLKIHGSDRKFTHCVVFRCGYGKTTPSCALFGFSDPEGNRWSFLFSAQWHLSLMLIFIDVNEPKSFHLSALEIWGVASRLTENFSKIVHFHYAVLDVIWSFVWFLMKM